MPAETDAPFTLFEVWERLSARLVAQQELPEPAGELLRSGFYLGARAAFMLLATPGPTTPQEALDRLRRLTEEAETVKYDMGYARRGGA